MISEECRKMNIAGMPYTVTLKKSGMPYETYTEVKELSIAETMFGEFIPINGLVYSTDIIRPSRICITHGWRIKTVLSRGNST